MSPNRLMRPPPGRVANYSHIDIQWARYKLVIFCAKQVAELAQELDEKAARTVGPEAEGNKLRTHVFRMASPNEVSTPPS